nr:TauD/TfdA family dioxygenase [Oricola nitratireducens]
MSKIKNEIAARGYIFLSGFRPDENTAEVANTLGIPLAPWDDRLIQTLIPRAEATPNTYSGIYGLGQFPFHTDLAHWRVPPRYLVLRCVIGYSDVPTLLVDGQALIRAVSLEVMARAIFKPRRPRDGVLQLLRLCEPIDDDGWLLRWDEVFLNPASKIGDVANLKVREWLTECEPLSISLANPNDTLLIDNWRILHARSPIPDGRGDRAIERVYLRGLN